MLLPEWSLSLEERCRFANILWLSLASACVLATLREHGQRDAALLQWKVFRSHHHRHFLDGLKKLGLEREATDAIKCGKYHYFSNTLGGLNMEYMEENPEKVWVRYRPPYPNSDSPLYPSVALAAMAPEVGEAVFRGWHAQNGPTLGNPRLGFVLTHLQAKGDPYDAGYFKMYDYDLGTEETFQRSPGEPGPRFDPARAPRLPHQDWPEERKAKALRNFAVEFANTTTMMLLEMYGVSGAHPIVAHAYRVTLAQRYKDLMQTLQIPDSSARGIATLIQRKRALLDEEVEIVEASSNQCTLRQRVRHPRLFPNLRQIPPSIDEAILEGWRVLVHLINPDLTIDMTSALTAGDPFYEWVIRPRRR